MSQNLKNKLKSSKIRNERNNFIVDIGVQNCGEGVSIREPDLGVHQTIA